MGRGGKVMPGVGEEVVGKRGGDGPLELLKEKGEYELSGVPDALKKKVPWIEQR